MVQSEHCFYALTPNALLTAVASKVAFCPKNRSMTDGVITSIGLTHRKRYIMATGGIQLRVIVSSLERGRALLLCIMLCATNQATRPGVSSFAISSALLLSRMSPSAKPQSS